MRAVSTHFVVVGSLLLFATLQVACARCDLAIAALSEYVQVRQTVFAAGNEAHRVWRIHTDGRLQVATWNNAGVLLSHNERAQPVPGLFTRAYTAAFSEQPDTQGDDGVLGRAGGSVSVSHAREGHTKARMFFDVPSSLSKLVTSLEDLTQTATQSPKGRYLWLEPSTRPADVELNLEAPGACDALGEVLSEAVAEGALITPLDQRFLDAQSPLFVRGKVSSIAVQGGWYVAAQLEGKK